RSWTSCGGKASSTPSTSSYSRPLLGARRLGSRGEDHVAEAGELAGRVVLVTGGSTGIGLGIARVLARQGARLLINGRSPEQGAAARRLLREAGAEAEFVAADVGTTDGVTHLFEVLRTGYGRLDLLCNNAGIRVVGSLAELPVEDWDAVMQVNARSVVLC